MQVGCAGCGQKSHDVSTCNNKARGNQRYSHYENVRAKFAKDVSFNYKKNQSNYGHRDSYNNPRDHHTYNNRENYRDSYRENHRDTAYSRRVAGDPRLEKYSREYDRETNLWSRSRERPQAPEVAKSSATNKHIHFDSNQDPRRSKQSSGEGYDPRKDLNMRGKSGNSEEDFKSKKSQKYRASVDSESEDREDKQLFRNFAKKAAKDIKRRK